jgi:hypothetical protein
MAHLARRQLDVYGLGLATSADTAASYNEVLGRLLQGGAEEQELGAKAIAEDPDFAVGHPGIALERTA